MFSPLLRRVVAWCQVQAVCLWPGALSGLWLLLLPTTAGAQEDFGGGKSYWGDALVDIMHNLCPAMEILRPTTISIALAFMFWWMLQAARGQSQKWKWVLTALIVMAFVYDPITWLELFGFDQIVTGPGDLWSWENMCAGF